MEKAKLKGFWEKNWGKIIIVAGVAATVSLAVIGCKSKRRCVRTITEGISYGFNDPIMLKDILTGNHCMLDGLPEVLAQKHLTEDVLITSVKFIFKEPITE